MPKQSTLLATSEEVLCRLRTIWCNRKVVMSDIWKVQDRSRYHGWEYYGAFFASTETHPLTVQPGVGKKRIYGEDHDITINISNTGSPVLQHAQYEGISLYLIQSGCLVRELINHIVFWKEHSYLQILVLESSSRIRVTHVVHGHQNSKQNIHCS